MNNNSCITQKRFLFWKYSDVVHDDKLYSIRKFMYCSTEFIVEWKCKKCGRTRERHFVGFDELLLLGIPADVLNEISTSIYLVSNMDKFIDFELARQAVQTEIKTNKEYEKLCQRYEKALAACHDIIRDVDIYYDTHMENSKIKECVKIASNGLTKLYQDYPDLFLKDILKRQ